MEEVDENEGYYSEEEEEVSGSVGEERKQTTRIINFLQDDDIKPFSLSSLPTQESKKQKAYESGEESKQPKTETFWLGKSTKETSTEAPS